MLTYINEHFECHTINQLDHKHRPKQLMLDHPYDTSQAKQEEKKETHTHTHTHTQGKDIHADGRIHFSFRTR